MQAKTFKFCRLIRRVSCILYFLCLHEHLSDAIQKSPWQPRLLIFLLLSTSTAGDSCSLGQLSLCWVWQVYLMLLIAGFLRFDQRLEVPYFEEAGPLSRVAIFRLVYVSTHGVQELLLFCDHFIDE